MTDPHFAYRSASGLSIGSSIPDCKPLPSFISPNGNVRTFQYSKNGSRLAWAAPESVKICDTLSPEMVVEIPRKNVVEVALSPKGNFISTWERPVKQDDGSIQNNLVLWDASTGEELLSWPQKNISNWNPQWTDDEQHCARMVTNEIHFYDTAGIVSAANSKGRPAQYRKFRLEGLGQFSLSPGKSPSFAAFVPENKGAPAIIRLYSITNFNFILATKTFFKADKVQMLWNNLGTNLLLLTTTDTDKTGKSYYGETNLYSLAVAGNFDCRVALDKEGAIHDVAWSPNSKEFVVVYGYMPSKATLFDHRANVVHQFGTLPRNYVSFNPQGRIICIAGFGNLAGQMDFWDRKTLTKIASCTASNATQCEWSPDGRYVMTSTLSPRLRVDNGFTLWHFRGVPVCRREVNEMYQVAWRPAPAGFSAPEMMGQLEAAPAAVAGLEAKVGSADAVAKPVGKYRPPGARGTATPDIFKREDEAPRRSTITSGASVPGAALKVAESELSKAALKNKKKRDAKKKQTLSEESPKSNSIEKTTPPQALNGAPTPATNAITGNAETDKKIRNLEKKLRQIEDLKERQKKGDKLELSQVAKIQGEDVILKELANLKV